jgi:CRP/FNR family transcriptional regulator, anaerobic regulatory protein
MEEIMKKFDLTDAEIADFWANAQIVSFSKKQHLLEEKQVNRYLYLMKKGVVRSYVTDAEGKDYSKAFFYAKTQDFVASFTSFKFQKPSNHFLEAIVDCEVWTWHHSYIHQKLVNDFRFYRFFRYCTDALFIRWEDREISMLRSTPEERYIQFKKENPDLTHAIPLRHIATYLGITPETLSRIRKRTGND